jgi:hypothetical protein
MVSDMYSREGILRTGGYPSTTQSGSLSTARYQSQMQGRIKLKNILRFDNPEDEKNHILGKLNKIFEA